MRKFSFTLFILLLLTNWAFAQVTASFDASVPSPACVPLTTMFTNTSTNANSYEWFVNGTSSSDETDFDRIFVTAGIYEVCLTANNENETDTYCENVELFTGTPFSFSVSNGTGCSPLQTSFDIDLAPSDIREIRVDFGDGTIETYADVASFSHTYLSGNIYDVTVTLTNMNGCETVVTENDLVEVTSSVTPAIMSNLNYSCEAPLTVDFTDITGGLLGNTNYAWDFGDGNTSTEQNPTHTYNSPGSYDVILTISNDLNECDAVRVFQNYINIGASPSFSFEEDGGDCNSVTVAFQDGTPTDVFSYFWEFGDGNISIEENPTHTYNTPGCHTPTLTVITTDGCESTYTSPTCVEVQGELELSYTSTGNISACEPPLTVDFDTDFQGDVTWDFGGLGSSTEQSPSFTFTEYGSFPISLTAMLPNGCEQSVTTTTIEILSPEPSFEADVLEGCTDLVVNFTNLSNFSNAQSWFWDFGDGNTSTEQNPTHIFTTPGNYDITLDVVLTDGCEGGRTLYNYIQVGSPPAVAFEADRFESCIEDPIQFSDITGDENIDFWLWDFGDGSMSDMQHPIHEYNDTGWMDVQLITGYNGCYDTLLIEDYVYLKAPKAVFVPNQTCDNPNLVQFTDSSIGADEWSWDFGDGNTSTEQNPSHTYTENGEYLVNLEVVNHETGCTDNLQVGISVQTPTAGFEINPTAVCLPQGGNTSVSVTNTSINAVNYDWSAPGVFVVTSEPNDPSPQFRFFLPGEYSGMELTVTDANGCPDTYVYPGTITVSQIVPNFSMTEQDPNCGQHFQFTDLSTAAYTDITSWFWDFGDGNTSTEQNPEHFYMNGGYFEPSLTITSGSGCSETFSLPNPIHIEVPIVTINTDTLICLGVESQFFNGAVASEISDFAWNFGDGNTSTEWEPTHTFSSEGYYDVCLTLTNADGCMGESCMTVHVEDAVVDFQGDNLIATCNPHIVQFEDLSGTAIAWQWDFGDGGTSTLQNPAHTFTDGGNYEICLTITTEAGCERTICKPNYIQVGGPAAQVEYIPGNEGCTPFDVTFNLSGSNIDSYTFDFGDGQTMSETDVTNNNFSLTHTYDFTGSFSPILLMSDATGCVDTVTLQPIHTQEMELGISALDTILCEGTDGIDFSSMITTNANVESIEWTFEGGNPSTSSQGNPSGIQFPNAGSYDVTLTVSTEYCTKTITKNDWIRVHPTPSVAFTAIPETNCGPATISLENMSTISSGTIVSWDWELGNGDDADTWNVTSNYSELGDYTVSLQATSDQGCAAANSQTISIYEPAIAHIDEDEIIICAGQTAFLNAEANGSVQWTPSTGLSCTTCPNPTANPSSSVMYYLEVTTVDGCTAQDSVYVERKSLAPPVVGLTDDMSICQGDIVQLIATGGNSPFQYAWDDSVEGLSCYENCSNPLVDIDTTSTFTVIVTDENGCSSLGSVTVEVRGSDLDILGNDRTICLGDSVQLNVSNQVSNPIWNNDSSLTCTTCPNPMASPVETTTYAVNVSYEDCPLTKEITVNVMYPDEVSAGEDISICNGQTAELQGEAPNPFMWSDGSSVISTDDLTPEISPSITTEYVISVSEDLCSISDTVIVEVNNELFMEAPDVQTCSGEPVQLTANGLGVETYTWSNPGLLDNPNIANPLATVTETTTFQVIGYNEYCGETTINVTVEVLEAPQVMLPSTQSYIPDNPIELNLTTDDDGSYSYQWQPNSSLSCMNCQNPTARPEGEVSYTVRVTNAAGCTTEATVLLRPLTDCLEDIVTVPTGFTPNQDGKNDKLHVLGMAEVQLFRVYNRWGEMVFETTDASEGWDGTFKSKPLNTDVYVWYIEAICPIDGSTISKKGDVTLVR